jgi:hypothetical protein
MKKEITLILLLLFPLTGCVTVFSDYQSAKILPEGSSEITGHYSNSNYHSDGDAQTAQSNMGIQYAYGLKERVEIRAMVQTPKANGEEYFEYLVIGGGPKFSVVKDHVAVYVPVGTVFGSGIEAIDQIEIHPTLLLSYDPIETMELNSSAKMIIPANSNKDMLLALNFGLGIIVSESFTIRPVYGMLFDPGEEGYFSDFGIGVSYRF